MPCKNAIEIRKLFANLTSVTNQTNKLKEELKMLKKCSPLHKK